MLTLSLWVSPSLSINHCTKSWPEKLLTNDWWSCITSLVCFSASNNQFPYQRKSQHYNTHINTCNICTYIDFFLWWYLFWNTWELFKCKQMYNTQFSNTWYNTKLTEGLLLIAVESWFPSIYSHLHLILLLCNTIYAVTNFICMGVCVQVAKLL